MKACAAVRGKSDKAKDALDDVAAEARQDLGYTLCRIQWMLAKDRIDDAARLMVAASPETMALQDTDQWWRERRSLARKLLDQGKFQTAYQVIRPAALPANEYYRSDFHFMCGWIALRYLDDPATAARHFARIDEGQVNPTVLARANYWRGRAAEALGQRMRCARAMKRPPATRPPITGSSRAPGLAATRSNCARPRPLSRPPMLRPRTNACAPPTCSTRSASAMSCSILPPISANKALMLPCSKRSASSPAAATTPARCCRSESPRSAAGCRSTITPFPTIGIPPHKQIAPEIEHSMIYSVARTESAFDQRDKSAANAVGLMQMTPEAGRDTAKRFEVKYDWDRMVSDPVYNTQMGAGELSALLSEYKGYHIMTFAGYNAGRGRVRDWVKAYGDPRDPKVDRGRLGRAHSVFRNAKLCPARDREFGSLPRAL